MMLKTTGLLTIILIACGLGGAHANGQLGNNEWNVRLTAESSAENLVDNGNLLGQLNASAAGYDRHDLEELAPFASPYLTVVFPHQSWGARSADYAVDYRAPATPDAWEFVVRSDDPNRNVKLKWDLSSTGDRSVFMHLVDTATNTQVPAQAASEYNFNMAGSQERLFVWVYSDGRLRAY